ncbi:hypothetical protein ACS0TY_009830 [Phlomoides rotata]
MIRKEFLLNVLGKLNQDSYGCNVGFRILILTRSVRRLLRFGFVFRSCLWNTGTLILSLLWLRQWVQLSSLMSAPPLVRWVILQGFLWNWI